MSIINYMIRCRLRDEACALPAEREDADQGGDVRASPGSRLEFGVATMHVPVLADARTARGHGSMDAGTLPEARVETVALRDVCGAPELRDRRLENHAGGELGGPALWIPLREGQLAFRQCRAMPDGGRYLRLSRCRQPHAAGNGRRRGRDRNREAALLGRRPHLTTWPGLAGG